jgi:hypothetical protein
MNYGAAALVTGATGGMKTPAQGTATPWLVPLALPGGGDWGFRGEAVAAVAPDSVPLAAVPPFIRRGCLIHVVQTT